MAITRLLLTLFCILSPAYIISGERLNYPITGKEAYQELQRRQMIRFICAPDDTWCDEINFLKRVTELTNKDDVEFIYIPLQVNREKKLTGVYQIDNIPSIEEKDFFAGRSFIFNNKGPIKNIRRIIGSATGTPPWIMYENYLAYINIPPSDNKIQMPGASRRIIFFEGEPKKR